MRLVAGTGEYGIIAERRRSYNVRAGFDVTMGIKLNIHGRRWLMLLALLGLTALVVTRFANLETLLDAFSEGQWQWVLLAAGVHLVYFVLYAVLYQWGFSTVDVDSRVKDLVKTVFAAIFVNAVAPSGGAGGAALFIDDAAQRGQSGARAAMGVVVVVLADLVTLIPFIIVGLFFLSSEQDLRPYAIISSIIFFLYISGLAGMLVMAGSRPEFLGRVLGWAQGRVNQIASWLKRPGWLGGDWAERITGEFAHAALAIAAHPWRLGFTFAIGLILHFINVVVLYILFLAFRQPVQLGTLVASLGLGIIFWVISIVPQGSGVVEGIMSLVFISLGIPKPKAVTIALAFRGLNFWLPLVIGFISLRATRSFHSRDGFLGDEGNNDPGAPDKSADSENDQPLKYAR